MLIRSAMTEDADRLAAFIAMAESEMVHHFTGTTDPGRSIEALKIFILGPANRYSLENAFVAEVDGQVAGGIIHFPADSQPGLDGVLLQALNERGYNLDTLFFEGKPGTYYLSTMGVSPEFRGHGVGGALMEAGEKEGARRGFSETSLLVSKGKPKAESLYARRGYTAIEPVRIGDVEYVRMTKSLDPILLGGL